MTYAAVASPVPLCMRRRSNDATSLAYLGPVWVALMNRLNSTDATDGDRRAYVPHTPTSLAPVFGLLTSWVCL